MSAGGPIPQGSSHLPARVDNNATQDSGTNDTPEWRSPSAHVGGRSDPVPQWPQKFFVNDVVWVHRAGDGWIEAKVTRVQTALSSWVYNLTDKNGRVLWSDRPKLFPQSELSYDEGDD